VFIRGGKLDVEGIAVTEDWPQELMEVVDILGAFGELLVHDVVEIPANTRIPLHSPKLNPYSHPFSRRTQKTAMPRSTPRSWTRSWTACHAGKLRVVPDNITTPPAPNWLAHARLRPQRTSKRIRPASPNPSRLRRPPPLPTAAPRRAAPRRRLSGGFTTNERVYDWLDKGATQARPLCPNPVPTFFPSSLHPHRAAAPTCPEPRSTRIPLLSSPRSAAVTAVVVVAATVVLAAAQVVVEYAVHMGVLSCGAHSAIYTVTE
jgi:hypothetical protein